MKTTFILLLSMILNNFCLAQTNNKVLNSEDDKTFYAMGYMLGGNLQRLQLSNSELESLYKGIQNSANNEKSEVDMGIYQNRITEVFKERMDAVALKEKQLGVDFLDKFVKANSAKKTDSGLAYVSLKEGTGTKPTSEDIIEVHYHGTLIDGTVFDSSVERGKSISFPLNRVIKGWTEGIQLMKEGSKYKFVIPSELAYGEAGAPPKIPGGATLVFEVELIKVTKPTQQTLPEKINYDFTSEKALKLKSGMNSSEILKMFGNPNSIKLSACGQNTGKTWSCTIWRYGTILDPIATFYFSGEAPDELYLNDFEISTFLK